jgi:hypothetical protein
MVPGDVLVKFPLGLVAPMTSDLLTLDQLDAHDSRRRRHFHQRWWPVGYDQFPRKRESIRP